MPCACWLCPRISIHALREEGDQAPQTRKEQAKYFYPRPPRGGRRWHLYSGLLGLRLLKLKLFRVESASLQVTGVPRRFIRRRVPYILNLLGLDDKYKHYPPELSGGEQQRVALARALVNNPDLLIADEPTGNIDPELSYEIVELLDEINKTGTTILMVTHEHELVNRFHHRTVTLEKGRIIRDQGGASHV